MRLIFIFCSREIFPFPGYGGFPNILTRCLYVRRAWFRYGISIFSIYSLFKNWDSLFNASFSSKFSCCGSSPVCNHYHNFTDMVDFLLRSESDEHESLGHRTLRSSFSHIQGHIHEVCIMSIFTVTHVVFSCTDKTCSLFIIA